MYLDSGKKPEYSERASADTGKKCELHTERPQPDGGVTPRTLLL